MYNFRLENIVHLFNQAVRHRLGMLVMIYQNA